MDAGACGGSVGELGSTAAEWETPRITTAGDVVELTLGNTSNDTADMKAYYW